MVPQNKILTVAYGAFSCTLEGFDDPFSAMTDIAEYFRDLAAEDRFFGAEPPTPDMAMLRMIAETRAQKAVEARSESGGVTLRPAEATHQAPEAPATPAPKPADTAATAAETGTAGGQLVESAAAKLARIRSVVEADRQPSTVYAEDDIAEFMSSRGSDTLAAAFADADDITPASPPPEGETDGEAAREALAIEVAEAGEAGTGIEDEGADGAKDIDLADAVAREDDASAEPALTAREAIADDDADAGAPSAGPRADEMDEAAEVAPDGAAERGAAFDTPEAAAPTGPEPDDIGSSTPPAASEPEQGTEIEAEIAATLSIIEAVERPEDSPAAMDNPDSADAKAEKAAADPETPQETVTGTLVLSDPAAIPADAMIEAPARADDATEGPATMGDDEAGAISGTATAHGDTEDAPGTAAQSEDRAGTDADAASADTVEPGADAAARPGRSIRVRKVRRAAVSAQAPALAAAETADGGSGDADTSAATDIDADLLAELAEIAAEASAIDAVADEGAETDEPSDTPAAPAVSDEDTDPELMAELAAIRAAEAPVAPESAKHDEARDLAGDETPTEASATADREPQDDVATGAGDDPDAALPSEDKAGTARGGPADRDMERLFAATDSRLHNSDASRRHANISHLKAAVAARRADGPAEDGVTRDDTGAYRMDLAQTVRPRRAGRADGARSGDGARPAPLVLVSEQRVGEGSGSEAPIRPRRAAPVADIPAETAPEEALPRRYAPEPGDGDHRATHAEMVEAAGDAQDFEKFAAGMGAVDLPEILEAAAVYTAEVMGDESFSRPRLLHLAAEACDELSREDGLRGFGQLLRDGTIRKVSRGEFALGGTSRFSVRERKAG